jgi:hypothetical protein
MEKEEGMEKEAQLSEERREGLYQKVKNMTVAEKVKLATFGNKEVRSILIRDANRVVQVAVIKNPRITDQEIEMIASSKTVDDEVLRLISENKEWLKNYNIKIALVKNPKTPLRTSLKFITHLREKDLKDLMNDKNIPNPLKMAARRLYEERKA